MIDLATLTQLVAGADPAVSIYVPTDPEQRDIRGAQAELRQFADLAQQRLERRGTHAEQITTMLAPLLDTDLERELEEHRGYGRVFFVSPGLRQVFALPEPVPPGMSVGRNFLLRPLLPALARNRSFHILALSATKSRLFDATPFALSERACVLPASAEAVFVEPESGLTRPLHPTGRPPSAGPLAGTAGDASGPAERIRKDEFLLEMNRMAAAVASALAGDPAPLVLVAEPDTAGHFRKAAGEKLPQLYQDVLMLDPSGLAETELLGRAVALLQPVFELELESVLDQANARLGTGRPDGCDPAGGDSGRGL